VGNDRRPRLDGIGNGTDGTIGSGYEDQIDVLGRAGDGLLPTRQGHDIPADLTESTSEAATGATGTNDVHRPSHRSSPIRQASDLADIGIVPALDQVGSQLAQGDHHEGTVPHPRVRDLQIRFRDGLAIDPEHVDIEGSRAPPDLADAPRLGLEPSTLAEQILSIEIRFELDHNVQECTLVGTSNRVGLVETGNCDYPFQSGDGASKVGLTLAEIRAEAEEYAPHRTDRGAHAASCRRAM
jgi:hypothetical protein